MFLRKMTAVTFAMAAFASGALVSGAFVSGASAAEQAIWVDGQNIKSNFLRVYGISLPPIGHVKFCDNHPQECQRRDNITSDGRFKLTQHRWRELKHLNSLVNKVIQPVTDKELYGRVEHWTYPVNYKGDCEDYVLLKRQKLIERGWPESSLLITVVLDENREGHAILTARTTQGDYILDNKNNKVIPWNKAPYTFIKRQSFSNPKVWVSLIPNNRWQRGRFSTAEKR